MKEIWLEKYRPRSLDEVVGQEDIVERLKAYVKSGNLPHLLFAGPPGTGKTTCAIALARDLFGDEWRSHFAELNASDERGIDVVRNKIKEYARMAPIGGGFNLIFLDECDHLTGDAQAALRRTMEMFTRTSRFVLSGNYSSRIIEPIQSRTAVFRFRPLKPDAIKAYLKRIARGEGLKVTEKAYDALVYIAGGDMRRGVNALQVGASVSEEVDEDVLYKTASTARPEEVKNLVETALGGDFLRAREILDNLLIEYGLSGEDVLRQIHRTVFEKSLRSPTDQFPDEFRVKLVEAIGEAEYRLVEGSNERIQLESLLAQFVLHGQELKKG